MFKVGVSFNMISSAFPRFEYYNPYFINGF